MVNTKEVVAEFERRMSTKVRKLEKLNLINLERENYQESTLQRNVLMVVM